MLEFTGIIIILKHYKIRYFPKIEYNNYLELYFINL